MKQMKKIIFGLFIIISASTYAQKFTSLADSVRKSRFVPSLSYAVLNTDGIIDMGAVGYIKLRSKDTVNVKNIYHLGGNTINFTAYIAAQLVAKGKLKWNTKVVDVFPAFKSSARPEYMSITFVDALSQRAGVPKMNIYTDFTSRPTFNGTETERHVAFTEWVLQRPGLYDSATGKMPLVYSNGSAVIAVAMMEKLTGKTYETLLDEFVNKPFGISVKFHWPNTLDKNEPWGHTDETGNILPTAPDHWWRMTPAFYAACDANISVVDYAKFIQDDLRGQRGLSAKLPQKTYELLHYAYPEYAIGWGNVDVNGNHIAEHDGTLSTFYCHVEIHKEKNLAIIVMCNAGSTPGKAACLNLARLIRENYFSYK